MKSGVLVIGGGPVGLTTALLLARHGVRAWVVESQRHPCPTLRAVGLDDECLRIWQACGLEGALDDDWDGGTGDQVICRYLGAHGRTFLKLRQYESDLGYPHAVAIHEPRITAKLREAVERHPLIEYRGGCRVERIHQDDPGVCLRVTSDEGAAELRGDWAVACDGRASTVRALLGIAMRGTTLPHPWLVANLADEDVLDHVQIRCDPRFPSVTLSVPHGVRRIERMLDANDPGDWIDDDAAVRARLGVAWPRAATARILDRSIIRFSASVAERWRDGRIFLAGDAAHTTPPFAAQGLGTGLRDASNIAFKLAGVVQGWLPESVLETYESERRPHQERMIRLALRLGTLMAPPTRGQATWTQLAAFTLSRFESLHRHLQMRGHGIRPVYRHGFLGAGRKAGRCLPQPWVVAFRNRRVRFDALLGNRMTWVAVGSGDRPGGLGGATIGPDDTVLVENRDFRDPQRLLQRAIGTQSIVLVRPDRVIHSHFPSRRSIGAFARSASCRTQTVLNHRVAAALHSSA